MIASNVQPLYSLYLCRAICTGRVRGVEVIDTRALCYPADQFTQMRRYLELATGCMERVQTTSSPQRRNLGLCQYLAIRLRLTVRQAWEYILHINHPHQGSLQLLRKLLMLAKDVEDFIHTCSTSDEGEWLRAELMWRYSPEHVSMLGCDLDTCRVAMHESISGNGSGAAMRTVTELSARRRSELEIIRLRARLDQNRLLEWLRIKATPVRSSEEVPDSEKRQLAAYILKRWAAAPPPSMAASHGSVGPSALSSCEVDYVSLEPPDDGDDHCLASSSASSVGKIIWLGELFAEKAFFASDDPTFGNESSILAGVPFHPSLVPMVCYAKDEIRGGCYIVMELMEGDLFHLMQTRLRRKRRQNRSSKAPPFMISEAVDIMLQIAQGVYHLHANRIVHRDIKSLNILYKTAKDPNLEAYVYVKVADVGLSKSNVRSSTLNQTMSKGTTRWMAPELLKRVDSGAATNHASTSNLKDVVETALVKHPFKCDIYSLGMVFYEILTGEIPFHATRNNNEVNRMVLDGLRPELPEDCPFRLEALIKKCWHPEASCRPNIGEICVELMYLICVLMTGVYVFRSNHFAIVLRAVGGTLCCACRINGLGRRGFLKLFCLIPIFWPAVLFNFWPKGAHAWPTSVLDIIVQKSSYLAPTLINFV